MEKKHTKNWIKTSFHTPVYSENGSIPVFSKQKHKNNQKQLASTGQ